ncbi:hypothetical protein FIBSPDRAFT_879521 [Athelia psychrophila]|uniref:Uncharacterized protein n=1 Tax=Athelia psychrophila TaxID=1759441 RepID=A0A167TWV3_9AGAM|nr:hypothetical protein FIBSPDRAFT_879521 [Fibularhizoctonia sp. CBS 109695]
MIMKMHLQPVGSALSAIAMRAAARLSKITNNLRFSPRVSRSAEAAHTGDTVNQHIQIPKNAKAGAQAATPSRYPLQDIKDFILSLTFEEKVKLAMLDTPKTLKRAMRLRRRVGFAPMSPIAEVLEIESEPFHFILMPATPIITSDTVNHHIRIPNNAKAGGAHAATLRRCPSQGIKGLGLGLTFEQKVNLAMRDTPIIIKRAMKLRRRVGFALMSPVTEVLEFESEPFYFIVMPATPNI